MEYVFSCRLVKHIGSASVTGCWFENVVWDPGVERHVPWVWQDFHYLFRRGFMLGRVLTTIQPVKVY